MKQLITALALAFAASASFAASHAAAAPMPAKPAAPAASAAPAAPAKPAAAAAEKKPTPQQEKMANCNKDAGDKKGDERKAFMKTCLSAKAASSPACDKSADDKKLAGAARTSHIKKCMADSKKG